MTQTSPLTNTARRIGTTAASLLLVAACTSQPTAKPAAAPSPSPTTVATPTKTPTPTPSPTPPAPPSQAAGPKLSVLNTCRKAAQPIQDAVPLFVEFANTNNVSTLDRAKYERAAQRLRQAYDVAAPNLATDIGTVTEAMERIVTFLHEGGSIHIDNQATGLAGITVVTECAKLGVIPTAG